MRDTRFQGALVSTTFEEKGLPHSSVITREKCRVFLLCFNTIIANEDGWGKFNTWEVEREMGDAGKREKVVAAVTA